MDTCDRRDAPACVYVLISRVVGNGENGDRSLRTAVEPEDTDSARCIILGVSLEYLFAIGALKTREFMGFEGTMMGIFG